MQKVKSEDHAIYTAKAIAGEDALIADAIRILETRLRVPDNYFSNPADVKNYVRLTISAEESEQFLVLFLNTRNGLIAAETMFHGTIDGASVYPREIVRRAIHHNAAALIVAHNHPSGVADPSQADIQITGRLRDALGLIDVRLLDHVIVGSREAVSLAERGQI